MKFNILICLAFSGLLFLMLSVFIGKPVFDLNDMQIACVSFVAFIWFFAFVTLSGMNLSYTPPDIEI